MTLDGTWVASFPRPRPLHPLHPGEGEREASSPSSAARVPAGVRLRTSNRITRETICPIPSHAAKLRPRPRPHPILSRPGATRVGGGGGGGGGGGVHRVLELDVFAVSDEIKPVQMQRNNIKFLTKASGGSFKMYLDEVQETGKGSSGDSL